MCVYIIICISFGFSYSKDKKPPYFLHHNWKLDPLYRMATYYFQILGKSVLSQLLTVSTVVAHAIGNVLFNGSQLFLFFSHWLSSRVFLSFQRGFPGSRCSTAKVWAESHPAALWRSGTDHQRPTSLFSASHSPNTTWNLNAVPVKPAYARPWILRAPRVFFPWVFL